MGESDDYSCMMKWKRRQISHSFFLSQLFSQHDHSCSLIVLRGRAKRRERRMGGGGGGRREGRKVRRGGEWGGREEEERGGKG